jgi:hypothetical protein
MHMQIDPGTDRLLSLKQAAERFPTRRRGARVAISTIWRWITGGTHTGVRLAAIRIGRQTYTSERAITEFIAAQNDPRNVVSPSARDAMKRLERAGL